MSMEVSRSFTWYCITFLKQPNPKGSLTLNIHGIFLHMPCGTNLQFPIQPGSNLPIMLTRQALHRSRTSSSSNFKPSHKPFLNTMSNVLSLICSTTYDQFVHGAVFHSQMITPSSSKLILIHQHNKRNYSCGIIDSVILESRGYELFSKSLELIHSKTSNLDSYHPLTTRALIVMLLYVPHVSMLSRSKRILLNLPSQGH
jgi:hypothetical protein